MPRTIESIVECHRAATERRNAGRPVWDHTVTIKHLYRDVVDPTDEDAKRIGPQVASTLRASSWWKSYETDGGVNEVELIADEIGGVDDLGHFNAVLDSMYDLADTDRVWIG